MNKRGTFDWGTMKWVSNSLPEKSNGKPKPTAKLKVKFDWSAYDNRDTTKRYGETAPWLKRYQDD